MNEGAILQFLRFLWQEEKWKENAACRGAKTELFFPERGQSIRPGQVYCHRCTVAKECRAYAARSHSTYGMWGGTMLKRRGDSPQENAVIVHITTRTKKEPDDPKKFESDSPGDVRGMPEALSG